LNKQALVEQLTNIISKNFELHKNNRINIADMMIGLIIARTVNLNVIAAYSSRIAKICQANIYRGFQYVIHRFKMTREQLAIAILNMYGLNGEGKLTLALDRTNWRYGKEDINLLVLSVIVKGCGIPVYWLELDSRGNSDTQERKQVLNNLIDLIGVNKIAYLLADREFVGEDWFSHLFDQRVKFVIRIKSNMLIKSAGKLLPGKELSSKASKINIVSFDGEIDNKPLSFQATVSSDNKLVLVASNHLGCTQLLRLYSKRWGIECLFSHLKTRGFNFEDTHITGKERISNLTKLIVLAFACTFLLGIVEAQRNPIMIKNHGYKQYSYFRYGLDLITGIIMQNFASGIEILGLCLSIAPENGCWEKLKNKLDNPYV
jgi:Transposase DDE domain